MTTPAAPQPDAGDIGRMVGVPRMLRHLGWRLRPRNRADCGLCRGSSTGTVAYQQNVWHCHRCHVGGDVFELVRNVNRCDFREALHYIADLAGVRLAESNRPDVKRQIAERHEHRKRVDSAADILAETEKALRLTTRESIHVEEHCLCALSNAASWSAGDWRCAAASYDALQGALAAYTLLAFGTIAERARYVLDPENQAEIEARVRLAGGVRTENGIWVEVLQ